MLQIKCVFGVGGVGGPYPLTSSLVRKEFHSGFLGNLIRDVSMQMDGRSEWVGCSQSDSLPGYLQGERWCEKLFWQRTRKSAAALPKANDVSSPHGPEQSRSKEELDGVILGPLQGCKQTLVATTVGRQLSRGCRLSYKLTPRIEMNWHEPRTTDELSDRNKNLQISLESFLLWASLALRVKSQNMMLPNQVKISFCSFFLYPVILTPGGWKSGFAS